MCSSSTNSDVSIDEKKDYREKLFQSLNLKLDEVIESLRMYDAYFRAHEEFTGFRLLKLAYILKHLGLQGIKMIVCRLKTHEKLPDALFENIRAHFGLIRQKVAEAKVISSKIIQLDYKKELPIAERKENAQLSSQEITIDTFRDILTRTEYSGIFIMGSQCLGWFDTFKQRHHHIAEFLMQHGYLVLCAMNPGHVKDITNWIRKVNNSLFLVNFNDVNIRRQILTTSIIYSNKNVFFHLVGTEPGTTIDEIKWLQACGVTIYYDFCDDLSPEIFAGLTQAQMTRHAYLLRDDRVLICATAMKLYEKVRTLRKSNVFLSRNAVSLEDWNYDPQTMDAPEAMKIVLEEKKPIVGFYGSFAAWLDYDLLKFFAQTCPDINLVMIGYDYEWGKGAFAKSRIEELPNVHIIPAQPYKELKRYSYYFDVCILPFRVYELTETVSPVKIFEYMAQGKPVVSTALPECKLYKSVLIAKDKYDFVRSVRKALTLRNNKSFVASLRQDATNNTWEKRGEQIINILKNIESLSQRCSLGKGALITCAIPLYNMAALLPRCLDSLLLPALSSPSILEVIIVDDGSTDNGLSSQIADQYARLFPGIVRVAHKPNGGHGSCINVAVAQAHGRFFKLIDSDDYLDPVAFIQLLRHLISSDIGIADLVVTDYVKRYEDNSMNLVSYEQRLTPWIVNDANDVFLALSKARDHLCYLHMHAITYQTKCLRRCPRITEHSFYVDQEYITYPLQYVQKIAYLPLPCYQYQLGRSGQSVDLTIIKHRIEQVGNILKNIQAFYQKLRVSNFALCEYLLGVCFEQSYFYLKYTESISGFSAVMNWWRKNKHHTATVHYRRLKYTFSSHLITREVRVKLVQKFHNSKVLSRIGKFILGI